jgi:hypothetical protein
MPPLEDERRQLAPGIRSPPMTAGTRQATPPRAAATRALREYADRGVFRGFSDGVGRSGRDEVSFRWLADSTFRVRLDPAARSLTFLDVLPNVPHRSAMDRAFRAFVGARSSAELP